MGGGRSGAQKTYRVGSQRLEVPYQASLRLRVDFEWEYDLLIEVRRRFEERKRDTGGAWPKIYLSVR
jgi:hypothetical protein